MDSYSVDNATKRPIAQICNSLFVAVIVLSLSSCSTLPKVQNKQAIPHDNKHIETEILSPSTNITNELNVGEPQKLVETPINELSHTEKLNYQEAIFALKNQHTKKALIIFEELQATQPWFIGAWLNGANVYIELGLWPEALHTLQQAQAINPKIASIYTLQAYCYRQLGQFNDAEAAYKNAISLKSDFALAYYNYGILLDLYLQKPMLALVHYEYFQALQDTPDKQVQRWIKELKRRIKSTPKNHLKWKEKLEEI